MKNLLHSFIWLPIIVAASIAFVFFQVKSKLPLEHVQSGYPVKAVEVMTVKKLPFRARAIAYGHVEPSVVVNAKSEVSGKIVYVHPDLERGASIAQGTIVLRIEPTTFELSLNQSEAGLQGSQSALTQLEVEEKSTRRAFAIAQDNLKVGQQEMQRSRALYEKNLVARSSLDKEAQKVLNLRQQVQDIEGKLSSFESRKAATMAQIDQSQSQVAQNQETLGRTEVSMPFDARIGQVSVEKGEFVSAGMALFVALGVEAVEINAQLPVKMFRPLVAGMALNSSDKSNQESINLQDFTMLNTALSKLELEARVRLVGDATADMVWPGKLVRLGESVDPVRDTLGLTVVVDKPYAGVIPGKRPPLLKGMYSSVELFSPVRSALVLPRKALHQGRVYVAREDNTLAIEELDILSMQGDLVVVNDPEDSLVGKKIIITDVIPVMQGLPLKPVQAGEFEAQLAEQALGEHAAESQQ